MSLATNSFYDFGDFRLDLTEKVLLRGGKFIPVTPKVFETLCALVENAGRIIEKDELMQKVWQDRFVEDSNLTFNIGMLRKALGDNAQNPKFIETVPRRGYRFIADVEAVTVANDNGQESKNGKARIFPNNGDYTADTALPLPVSEKSKKSDLPFAAVAVLLAGIVAGGFWYARSRNAEFPVFAAPFASEKLSTNGRVFHAAVSPDGKNVVYTNFSGDKQSVWLRQLETSNNVEIIPPSDDVYMGIALSPDGNFLYFVRRPKGGAVTLAATYRVSIFGGVPQKIVSDAQGWMSVSPDGSKISFVRCSYSADDYCSLWIADSSDGKNERKLVSRPHPFRIGDNEFSPDGKTIAFAVGQSENQANEFGLVEVDVENGAERELTTQKFFNIRHLAWMPNQSGLLITASRIPNKNFRIWQVSPARDEAESLTKDSENYSCVSLDKAASVIVSTQMKDDFGLSVYQTENPADKRTLTNAIHAAFAPNGKIVFSSLMFGNDDVWSMNADGSEQKQLTKHAADDSTAVVSPDGNFIFFASNRTGAAHVWRMNHDGSNQTQITQFEGGFPLHVSPDGRWIYYRSALQKKLWRASTNGASEQLAADRRSYTPAFSPVDSQVAYLAERDGKGVIDIISLADWQTIKTFPLPDGNTGAMHLVWSGDGKNLLYVVADGEFKNNALWRQPLDAETPQKIADLGGELVESFALAPDGKSFAVVQGSWRHDAVLIKGLK